MFTTSLNSRQYEKLRGITWAMCGVAVFSGLALLTSALLGYVRGVDGAVTMFVLSVGGVSSGVLETLSRRRRGTGAPIVFLIVNFALTTVGVWLLTGLLPH
ncbi:DUF4190 domain-containing protein [Prescottella defluvii]|uniref:hypothetical protein n=1 Tax=Prescottella defluvii TaxID=1323361 RepID=UPI00068F5A5C|nr:hypothetical protein [Prescottella defluvii]